MRTLGGWVAYSYKAWIAAVLAFVTALIQATADGSGITLHEWLVAVGAVVLAFATTFGVTNGPKPPVSARSVRRRAD